MSKSKTKMLKMLVIDDEKIVLDACKRIFSAEEYEVLTTDSARRGLELVAENKFDVILCDWKMPELDGLDTVEMIDKRSPGSAIVMITGFPAVERATDAMKRGAVDYVAKPFTPEEILAAVQKAMKRKEQDRVKGVAEVEKIVRSISFPVPSMEDIAPKTIAETVAQKVGVGKTTSPWLSVLVLGILAGAYIGFGGMLATTVSFDMAGYLGVGFTKFMTGAVFSLGLMLVIIAGAELFTGNNLMISSAIAREITFGRMLKRWGLVYVANFVGSILIALLFVFSGLWRLSDGALGVAAVKIAYGKVNLPFLQALLRGIGCNWLVCLAVWMALAARQTIGKIFAIFFPIMGFVALGFEHSIANMYFIPTGIFLRFYGGVATPSGMAPESLSWLTFLLKNLLPVTIGNIIGGAVFVGMSYWSAYLRPSGQSPAK
ncbi:MAG: formate/nitrite transporter family protein [Spirochaetaceae bacterium]|nr:MAG: formate/nitrite transporter family protein [Spirochaetaceae bacterium]